MLDMGVIMDKFGIFNLLNSFLGQNANTSNDTSLNSSNEKTEKPTSSNGVLQSLLSLLNTNKTTGVAPEQNKAERKNEVESVRTIPLQSGMLSTMSSHEQFIKRVQTKNKN